jgi:hypothetical protein
MIDMVKREDIATDLILVELAQLEKVCVTVSPPYGTR